MKDIYKRIVRIKELDKIRKERLSSFGIDVLKFNNCAVLPGFTDVHVHLREPGFLYKETVATGTRAAAAGGFTDIITMPNLKPCPDCMQNLKIQLQAIRKDAVVDVKVTGSITRGEEGRELSSMEEMAPYVIGFTDDGKGLMSDDLMKKAMETAAGLGLPVIAHCEDENYTKESPEAEYMQLERDLELVRQTGCRYHACHISTWQSVELMRRAKAEGLDVSCETAPHYLVLDREAIERILKNERKQGNDTETAEGRFKMNPPIKGLRDREALLEAVEDGTIDMIATDHAPHSIEEKSRGYEGSAYGIVGMETALPVLYTELVLKNIISYSRLMELMAVNPAKRFGTGNAAMSAGTGELPDRFSLWDIDAEYTVKPDDFETKGRSTPFEGWKVKGKSVATVIGGRVIWQR